MDRSLKAETVDVYLNSIKHADVRALEKILTDDFTLQLPQPTAKTHALSRSEAITFLTTVPGLNFSTDTFSFHVIEVVETADRYVAEMSLQARTNTAQHYSNVYIMWFKFKGARICECRQHVDTAYVATLLK